MRTSVKSSKTGSKRAWRILFFIIYFFSVFILQKILTRNLKESSINYLKEINANKSFSEGAFAFFNIITYFAHVAIYLVALAVVFNFTNIYKSFILLMVVLNTYLFSGLIKLILAEPRPFFIEGEIEMHDYSCGLGFGNPSGHSVSGTAFYLTLWHIVFESSKLKNRIIVKYVSLSIMMVILFLIFFGRFIAGTNSLDQLIFGFMLGAGIYLCIFHVLCVNVNDGLQFFAFMNVRNLIIFTINFLIFLSALLVYLFRPNDNHLEQWKNTIRNGVNAEKCAEKIDSLDTFYREAFLNIGMFLANFGAFLGLKCEFYISFNFNIGNWNQYNFEKVEKTDDSLLSKIGDIEMQWNHTDMCKNVLRLGVILILSIIMLLPFFFVSRNEPLSVVFLFKFFIPIFLVAFSMFFLFKILVRKLKLDNPTIFTQLQNESTHTI